MLKKLRILESLRNWEGTAKEGLRNGTDGTLSYDRTHYCYATLTSNLLIIHRLMSLFTCLWHIGIKPEYNPRESENGCNPSGWRTCPKWLTPVESRSSILFFVF